MLEDTLYEDMKKAMKEKNEVKLSTLRMLRASMKNFALDKKKDVLTDDETYELIAKQIKQRKDSIEQFGKGGRHDLAAKEESELKILQAYLPTQLSETEIRSLAEETIKSLGVQLKKDMGRVMKELIPKVKGRADAKIVNEIVASCLK